MPYKRYDTENLDQALASIRNGEMTAYKASKVYKVPYQTLLDKLKNIHPNPSGHATVLTKEEEELLVKWIHHMAEIGFPVTKVQLLHSVGKLVKELNRPNPFKDGIPGRHWYEAFLKRNPYVSSRVCQALTTARVGATEEKIRHWFDSVYKYLEENKCLEILQDSSRIFNCDESAFFLCPKGQAVLARRGQKSVYCRSGNDEKDAVNYEKLLKSTKSSDAGSTSDSRSDVSTPFDDEKLVHEQSSKQLENTSLCPAISKKFVAELEKLLGIEKLKLFKDCDGVWQGDIKDENLFYFWKKVNGCNNDELEIGESTLEANDCTLTNIEDHILNFDNFNILEGVIESDGTVTLTPHLTLSSPTPVTEHTANCFEKSSRLPSKGSESVETDNDNLSFNNFNPVFNITSTPTTKSKEARKVTVPVRLSQHENLTPPQETLSIKSPVKSFPSNCTTPPAHRSCGTNENIVPEANISCLNTDSVLNNTSTPNIESKEELELLTAPVKPSQNENLTSPKQTLTTKSLVLSNCTTLPAQQSCETNENVLSEGNVSCLNTNLQAKKSVTNSNAKAINITEILEDCAPSKPKKSQFPTPFKNSLLWPEIEINKKTNKKVKKSLTPTIATCTEYMDYQRRLDQDKKEKIEKTELRKKEREEKAKAKLTAKTKLNKNKDTDFQTNKKEKSKTKSKKTRHSEAAQSLEAENITEGIKENITPTKEISFKAGEYVVVTYEGENFPGLITKLSEGTSKTYDVKTMTMSGLDTITGRVNWRWPEKDDILTYDCEDLVKKIKAPIPLNKRGVYSVADI